MLIDFRERGQEAGGGVRWERKRERERHREREREGEKHQSVASNAT